MPAPVQNQPVSTTEPLDTRSLLEDDVVEEGADKIDLKDPEDKEDKIDLDDEDDKDEKLGKKSKDKETDSEEDLEESEEPDEEELSLATPVRRQEILKKYPNLFKDFPYLQTAYYRDQKMTEIFPTVEDAENAAQNLQDFGKFRDDLLTGNLDSVLSTVKEADPNAFAKIVDNVLVAIGKQDINAYHHILGNTTKNIVQAMMQQSQQLNNKDLGVAATLLYQFIFGTNNFTAPQTFAKNEPEKKDDISEERQRFMQERFETHRNELDTKITNSLRATIAENIDPNGKMSKYVKDKAIEDCVAFVSSGLNSDRQLQGHLTKLWERAVKSNFSSDSINAISSTLKARAKAGLRNNILKARNLALQGSEQSESRERKSNPLTPGRSASSSNASGNKGSGSKQNKMPAGMSTREYFDLED